MALALKHVRVYNRCMNSLRKAIAIAGSQRKIAEACMTRQSTVAQWVKRESVPAKYCASIEQATDGAVTRQDLRPKDWQRIWPELADQQTALQGVA